MRIELSGLLPPDTTFRPSGLNAAEFTMLVCPVIVCSQSPIVALYTRTVLSQLAVTIFRPSRLNAAEVTELVCPVIVCSQSPVAAL